MERSLHRAIAALPLFGVPVPVPSRRLAEPVHEGASTIPFRAAHEVFVSRSAEIRAREDAHVPGEAAGARYFSGFSLNFVSQPPQQK